MGCDFYSSQFFNFHCRTGCHFEGFCSGAGDDLSHGHCTDFVGSGQKMVCSFAQMLCMECGFGWYCGRDHRTRHWQQYFGAIFAVLFHWLRLGVASSSGTIGWSGRRKSTPTARENLT